MEEKIPPENNRRMLRANARHEKRDEAWRKRVQQEKEALEKYKVWRAAEPSRLMQETLKDFEDLCFAPPNKPENLPRPSRGIVGELSVMLNALYDEESMMKQYKIHKNERETFGTEDLAATALARIIQMRGSANLDDYLYKPLFPDDPPPRDPGIRLTTVLDRMTAEIRKDFAKELEGKKAAPPQVFRP